MEITIDVNDVESDFRFWECVQRRENENLPNSLSDIYFNDCQTSKYLTKYFKGYMFAPTAFYVDATLEAKTRAARSIDELDTVLAEQSETHDLYLFKLIFFPPVPVYVTIDHITFEPKTLDKPVLRDAHWKIRYAAVEKK